MSNNLILNKDFSALIVEDEAILAMTLKRTLTKMGLTVSGIISSPDEAILHVENHYPDLAIIDINLNASKTGIDVANYIWKNFNVPIIFLTSYYNDKILNKAMESEPYAYLLKPCRKEELKVAINTVMHKHNFFFKNKNSFSKNKNKFIYINEFTKFDIEESILFVNDKLVKLTKNEKKLFEILAKEKNKIISFERIYNFIWREDAYDLAKLRSLIYRLKIKLDFNPIENFYEEGYKVKTFDKID